MSARLGSWKSVVAVAFLYGAALVLPSAPLQAEDDAQQGINQAKALSAAFESVALKITPSVVNISAVKKPVKNPIPRNRQDPFFDQFKEFFGDEFLERFGAPQNPDGGSRQGLGTGVIVDDQGHIITNNHVIGDADEVTVRLHDEREVKAEIVGKDPRTDLAVIKIKSGKTSLIPARLGDSDNLKIGEWVLAAGNPFGLDNSITAGIVSAKGRSIMGGGQYEDFIQTDAAINPGNSGGPLINLEGDVIGINTAIFSRSGGYMGIGFAIPVNMAKNVLESLITKGKVVRGWLGVGIQNLTEDLAKSFNYPATNGALVGHVEKGGPADKAGLKQGDIIVKLDGTPIKDINQLRNSVAAIAPGKKVALEIVRNGRKQDTSVEVGELPSTLGVEEIAPEESPSIDIGVAIENLTPDLARRLGAKSSTGVIVRSVRPAGIADKAGLQPRDIIISIDGKPIKNSTEFYEELEGANLDNGVRLVVESQGMERFVFLRSAE